MELKPIAEKIRAARLARKLSLRKFAALADVDHTTLIRIERGDDVKASAFLNAAREAGYMFLFRPTEERFE